MNFEYPKNVRFGCNRCALCCGDTEDRVRTILLMRIEADRISRATSKSLHEFAEKVEDFESYSYRMKKTRDGKCVFLRDNVCVIYQLRPLICRFYPFGLKDVGNNRHVFSYTDECPCIGKGSLVKKEYFEELFKVSVKLMQENVTQDNGDNDRNGV